MPVTALFAYFEVDLTPITNMSYKGLQIIAVWILSLPLSIMLLVSGLVFGILIYWLWME